jgi:hypothetical protein
MSAVAKLKALLGLTDSTEQDGLEVLQGFLEERQARLSLEAVYGRPTVNTQGEVTAIFPITLYHEDERYAEHAKEFPLPDDGLEDDSAPLTKFLNEHGITSVESLGDIQGQTDNAVLKDNGEIEVGSGVSL